MYDEKESGRNYINDIPYQDELTVDVAIIGAGTGGVAVAYALKGHDIVIVDGNTVLGGNAVASRVNTWIQGLPAPYLDIIYTELHNDGNVTGEYDKSWLPDNFALTTPTNDLIFDVAALAKKYNADLVASGVNIMLSHAFLSVGEMADGVVKSVYIKKLTTGNIIKIKANWFIDSTNTGILCRSAKNAYEYGRDAQATYNESLAMTTPTQDMNEPSLFFQIEEGYDDSAILDKVTTVYIDNKDTIIKPDYIKNDGYFSEIFEECWVNPMTGCGYNGSDVLKHDHSDMLKLMKTRTLEYWKYIKLLITQAHNLGKTGYLGGWDITTTYNKGFVKFADDFGIRESYRIKCEGTLTQNDLSALISSTSISDFIACGSHNVDMHITDGLGDITTFNSTNLRPYGISYSCIIPKNLKNVLIASIAYGTSQIALASARTNKVISQLGWGAGNAIKLCLDKRLEDVRDVIRGGYIEELQSDTYTKFTTRLAELESKMKKNF